MGQKFTMRDGTEIDEADLGWQVLDPDGNVIESGPISIAELTSDAREALGLTPVEDTTT